MKFDPILVTVVIVTYNRPNVILSTLENLKKQDYKNLEIILVDNGSTGKIPSMENIGVKVIHLDNNYGVDAFNKVIYDIKSKYFVILDDDSYPEDGAILRAVSFLEENSVCGAVALNIYNSKLGFYETKDLKQGFVHLFVGCGVVLRTEVISKIGFYDNLFFIYVNEIDLSIRLLDEGYKIYYDEKAKAIHLSAGVSSNNYSSPFISEYRFYHVTCGYLIFLFKHFSVKWIIVYSLKWNLNRLIVAIRFKYFNTYLKSLLRFIKLFPKVVERRKQVKKEVQLIYQNGNMPLMDRDFFPNFNKKKYFPFKHFV